MRGSGQGALVGSLWRFLAAALFVVAIGACSDNGGTADSEGSARSRTRAAPDALGRRDAPPEAVQSLLDYSGFGGGEGCPGPGTEPAVGVFAYPPNTDAGFAFDSRDGPYTGSQVGDLFTMCAEGFDPGRAVDFDVLDPNGATALASSADATDDGTAQVTLRTEPGDSPGRYTVRVTQGSVEVTRRFKVERATSPRLVNVSSRFDFARGDRVEIGLAGYAPNATVEIALYTSEDPNGGTFEFDTLVGVDTNSAGEAVLELLIPPDARFTGVLAQTPNLPNDDYLHADRLSIDVDQ